jgi:DNA-binding IscR family transcriptional regulator
MRKSQIKKSVPAPVEEASWTFFTNHGHVLLCLAQQPGMLLREVALTVGITERMVQKIIADLESGGVLTREKQGRQNTYTINAKLPLRHTVEAHCTIEGLIDFVLASRPGAKKK